MTVLTGDDGECWAFKCTNEPDCRLHGGDDEAIVCEAHARAYAEAGWERYERLTEGEEVRSRGER